MENVDIQIVKNAHQGHWFSAGAMRFFNSRIAQTATLKDGKA